MKRLLILTLLGGCSWSQFDDISDSTPVHAQEKPDGVKASDYGFAIANGTAASETTGGRLAVLSTGNGNYSSLNYDAGGKTSLGDSETLGIHTIDTLTNNALLISDTAGNVAIIDNSNVGTIVAVHGVSTALSVDSQIPTPMKPDAATFAGSRIVIAAGPQMAGGFNLFSLNNGGVNTCTAADNMGALSAIAIAADDTHLWVWSKTGAFYSYALTAVDAAPPCTIAAPGSTAMVGPAPNGGRIDIAGGFAILTTFDTPSTTVGQVTVVNLATLAVTPPMLAHGVHSAAFAVFDGMGALVLGYPNRASGSTPNAGAIDIHLFDMASGTLTGTPEQSFSDTQAGSSLLLGRQVTTMIYNGKPIIVASASSIIYAYYATAIYQKR